MLNPCQCACPSIENCWCTVKLDEILYNWTIDDFSSREAKDLLDLSITSPTFSAPTNHGIHWYLQLDFDSISGNKTIDLTLHLSSKSKPTKVYAKFGFSVLNKNREEKRLKIDGSDELALGEFDNRPSADEYDKQVGYICAGLFERDEIFRNELLIDDKLIISCRMEFFEMNETNVRKMFRRCNSASFQHLSADFGSMLGNLNFTDVVLSVQGKNYSVHKNVLSARSKVFAAMFNHNATWTKENRVQIADMDKEVMEEILRYLYTGNCMHVDELAKGLFVAADKYDLAYLKSICEESMYKNLTIENAPNILVLADTYRSDTLKSKVIEFIISKSSDILDTTNWNTIMPSYPLLLNEVLRIALSRQNVTI